MNIRAGINWSKLAAALMLMCAVLSFGVMAQDDSNEPLDEDAAAALIEELTDGLPDLIDDEAAVTKINDKWYAREDLVGKTQTQILDMLFADIKSVVRDPETQKNIWDTWTGAADQTEAEETEPEEEEAEGREHVEDADPLVVGGGQPADDPAWFRDAARSGGDAHADPGAGDGDAPTREIQASNADGGTIRTVKRMNAWFSPQNSAHSPR